MTRQMDPYMERLLKFSDALNAFVDRVGRLAAWLAVAMMLVILTDVILRRYFIIGSTKLQDLEWHLHGGLFLLCLGFGYLRGAHVRIELVWERFSQRTKVAIEALGCLLFLLPYCAAILKFGFDYAEMSYLNQEVSASSTGLPMRWIIKFVLVAGFGILAMAGVATLIRALIFLFGPAHLREAAKIEAITDDTPQAV